MEAAPLATNTLAPITKSSGLVEYKCGHLYSDTFTFDAYGETLPVNESQLAKRELCGECLLTKLKQCTIRCARCGCMILPRTTVAVYPDNPVNFKERGWVTKPDPDHVLGCIRITCCPSGFLIAGYWDGEKFVRKT